MRHYPGETRQRSCAGQCLSFSVVRCVMADISDRERRFGSAVFHAPPPGCWSLVRWVSQRALADHILCVEFVVRAMSLSCTFATRLNVWRSWPALIKHAVRPLEHGITGEAVEANVFEVDADAGAEASMPWAEEKLGASQKTLGGSRR